MVTRLGDDGRPGKDWLFHHSVDPKTMARNGKRTGRRHSRLNFAVLLPFLEFDSSIAMQ